MNSKRTENCVKLQNFLTNFICIKIGKAIIQNEEFSGDEYWPKSAFLWCSERFSGFWDCHSLRLNFWKGILNLYVLIYVWVHVCMWRLDDPWVLFLKLCTPLKSFKNILLYVYNVCPCEFIMHHRHVGASRRHQNLLKLELLAVVNHLVGTENWTQVFYESSEHSELVNNLPGSHLFLRWGLSLAWISSSG